MFALSVFGVFILIGALVPSSTPTSSDETSTVADSNSETAPTETPESVLDDDSVFANGWVEAQTAEPTVEELNNYEVYYTPRLDADTFATESWNSTLAATYDALFTFGYNVSNNFVSAYNTLYDAREIISTDNTIVFADAAVNSSEPQCGFNGNLVAVAGGLENYAAPLPLAVSQNNFAFITDLDRDEEYASTLTTVGFYSIVGEEKGLVFVGASESWQELVFVNMLLNEDDTMRVAGKQILSKYPVLEEAPERALTGNENLTELVLNSHRAMLNKNINMVYEDSFWISGQASKDYVLKFYKEQNYSLENPAYNGVTVDDLTNIVSQLETYNSDNESTLAYNFDDKTAYQLEVSDNGEFNILTLNGEETQYDCASSFE